VLAERRRRLSDVNVGGYVAWPENIARRANREDGVTGKILEGVLKLQILLDEAESGHPTYWRSGGDVLT